MSNVNESRSNTGYLLFISLLIILMVMSVTQLDLTLKRAIIRDKDAQITNLSNEVNELRELVKKNNASFEEKKCKLPPHRVIENDTRRNYYFDSLFKGDGIKETNEKIGKLAEEMQEISKRNPNIITITLHVLSCGFLIVLRVYALCIYSLIEWGFNTCLTLCYLSTAY